MIRGICFQWENVWIRSSRLYKEFQGTPFVSRNMNTYPVVNLPVVNFRCLPIFSITPPPH